MIDNKTSCFCGHEFLEQDASPPQVNVNESKVYMAQNKIVYSFEPIVVMIESNIKNGHNIMWDCLNVEYMLHVIKHFDMIYHNVKHELVHLTRSNSSNGIMSSIIVQNEFGLKFNDVDKFHNEILEIVQNGQFKV